MRCFAWRWYNNRKRILYFFKASTGERRKRKSRKRQKIGQRKSQTRGSRAGDKGTTASSYLQTFSKAEKQNERLRKNQSLNGRGEEFRCKLKEINRKENLTKTEEFDFSSGVNT